jgi:hypothetical protein
MDRPQQPAKAVEDRSRSPSRLQAKRAGAAARTIPSGAEEREPDHAEDQHRQPGRDREERKHRRAGLGLAGFGRGFHDLTTFSRCQCCPRFPVVRERLAASRPRMQRLIGDDVPALTARKVSPLARDARLAIVPRAPVPTPRSSGRLTPFRESLPGSLETRFRGGILAGRRLLRFRSIPWPPAPTGKAFCAFRS